jgi:isocitrate lyase
MEENNIQSKQMSHNWEFDERWRGIKRNYRPEDVINLRGTVNIDYSLASSGARKFWNLLKSNDFIPALGALTGNQAVQQVKAGLKAIYLSGWQVAADANLANTMYPDQSLYPSNSVPEVVRKINCALQRADQIEFSEGKITRDWMVPIIADAEAGFGGVLNAFELMKLMIEAGASAVHFEDQQASEKKCGHMGGKVLIPTSQFIRTLTAARLAADVMNAPTVLIGRTDAAGASLLTSDIDENDLEFITGDRTPEGFFKIKSGLEMAIKRALSYAPFADLIWCETSRPDLGEAREFAEAIHHKFPHKILAYNCSPSFNWRQNLSDSKISTFQTELSKLGYKFQFVTLAGFHALNSSMYKLAHDYKQCGMSAYAKLQQDEFDMEKIGYTATKHQREVGAGYFDKVNLIISSGESSTLALKGSTENEQFLS